MITNNIYNKVFTDYAISLLADKVITYKEYAFLTKIKSTCFLKENMKMTYSKVTTSSLALDFNIEKNHIYPILSKLEKLDLIKKYYHFQGKTYQNLSSINMKVMKKDVKVWYKINITPTLQNLLNKHEK